MNELQQDILKKVLEEEPISLYSPYVPVVMTIVCRSVCRLWRDLVAAHPIRYSPLIPCRRFASVVMSRGWMSILRWAKSCTGGCLWDFEDFKKAARMGMVDMMKFLQTQRHFDTLRKYGTERKAVLTCCRGNTEAISYLRDAGSHCDLQDLAVVAAGSGQVEVLQWILDQDPSVSMLFGKLFAKLFTGVAATSSRQLAGMKWFKENDKDGKIEWTVMIFRAVANELEAMKWLKANGCPWDESVFEAALARGSMACITWLHESGCPRDGRHGKQLLLSGVEECVVTKRSP